MRPSTAQKEALAKYLLYMEHNNPGFADKIGARLGIPRTGMGSMNGLGGIGDIFDKFFGNDDEFTPGSDSFVGPMPQQDFQTPPFVAEDSGNWFSNIIDAAKEIVPAVLKTREQVKWSDLQLERAKQGLEPIPTAGYSAPPILLEVAPQKGALTKALGYDSGFNPLPWIIGAGIGAFILMNK